MSLNPRKNSYEKLSFPKINSEKRPKNHTSKSTHIYYASALHQTNTVQKCTSNTRPLALLWIRKARHALRRLLWTKMSILFIAVQSNIYYKTYSALCTTCRNGTVQYSRTSQYRILYYAREYKFKCIPYVTSRRNGARVKLRSERKHKCINQFVL